MTDRPPAPEPRHLAALSREDRRLALDAWLAGLLAAALHPDAPDPETLHPGTLDPDALHPDTRPPGGVALIAVGSLGRGEPAPFGDLDLVLVHDGRPDIAAVAEALWYPIWDAGFRLDHSVRTVAEAAQLAGTDARAGFALLDARLLAGDTGLSAALRAGARTAWRRAAGVLLPQLRDLRWTCRGQVGELGFLVEPDLKQAYGGLREGQALRAVAAAQLADPPAADLEADYRFLLDVREQLRRRSGQRDDVLVRQEQRPVAEALGLAGEDGLLRAVSLAGRRLAYAADGTWRRVELALRRPPSGLPRRVRREPLAEGIVRHGDDVVLARDARPEHDPGLPLRAAAAAARAGLLLAPSTLAVLAARTPPLPEPWPAEVRWSFVRLLAAGRGAVPVIEQLDQAGLLARALPEWDRVRSLPQRHPWHRFTVDRHLVETAAAAAELTHDVDRPDLLLLGALLHDLGKGWPGDHSEAGEPVAASIAGRMGFAPNDVATIGALVRHHLLLPDTATRRDVDDPATVERVADTIGRDAAVLELLHALARADGAATSPPAWTAWKAHLVAVLVARVRASLGEAPAPEPDPVLEPAEPHSVASSATSSATSEESGPAAVTVGIADVADGHQITITGPARTGFLSSCAGVLALNQLDVRAAKLSAEGGLVTAVFAVRPRFGRPPVPAILADGVHAALTGSLPLAARLRQREADYRQDRGRGAAPRLSWHDHEVPGEATGIVEVRARDSAGLLYRLTAALVEQGLEVTSARIETIGADAADSFYLSNPAGGPIDAGHRARVEAALVVATSS